MLTVVVLFLIVSICLCKRKERLGEAPQVHQDKESKAMNAIASILFMAVIATSLIVWLMVDEGEIRKPTLEFLIYIVVFSTVLSVYTIHKADSSNDRPFLHYESLLFFFSCLSVLVLSQWSAWIAFPCAISAVVIRMKF